MFDKSNWTLIQHNIYLNLARSDHQLKKTFQSRKSYLKALHNIEVSDSLRHQKKVINEIISEINSRG